MIPFTEIYQDLLQQRLEQKGNHNVIEWLHQLNFDDLFMIVSY